jgi:hypothetical protein
MGRFITLNVIMDLIYAFLYKDRTFSAKVNQYDIYLIDLFD